MIKTLSTYNIDTKWLLKLPLCNKHFKGHNTTKNDTFKHAYVVLIMFCIDNNPLFGFLDQ